MTMQPRTPDMTSPHCACCASIAILLPLVERMEAKLDGLIEAMAEEDEGETGSMSLDEKGESRRPATL